jgi:uncharacterized protein (UPF0335 family)
MSRVDEYYCGCLPEIQGLEQRIEKLEEEKARLQQRIDDLLEEAAGLRMAIAEINHTRAG